MNLQQIEYIIALDQFKNFTKAAEACFITQATLSTMIKKLEEELNLVIFDRKTTPIITTDCGKEIIQEAKKIQFHAMNLKQISSTIKGKIEGDLKIGVIPTVAGNLLHRIIPQLVKKYPSFKLIISEIPTEQVIAQLKKGEIDAGIVSTPLRLDDLEEEILYYEKLMVYGNEHKNKKYILMKEMSNAKIWLLEEGNCLRSQFINVCSLNPKKFESNIVYQPNSYDSLLNLVDTLKGLTLIPELYVKDLSKAKKGKVLDFKSPYPVREISLIYHRPFAKLRLIQALAQEIKNTIQPLLETSKLKNKEMIIAEV